MEILETQSLFAENPIATPETDQQRPRGTSDDVSGAFSIENFSSASALSSTHEDAEGWLAYLNRFQPSNFHYRDGGVAVWAYEEDYDNWEDTYGMDACLAVYHSGHGNMAADGTFQAPMGAHWGGLGDWAYSSRMHLGNEQANYIFWSTCLSLRVHEGHDPVRTWHGANGGFRMLFGFETTSVDRPEYGRWFWEEWNAGDSLAEPGLTPAGASRRTRRRRWWPVVLTQKRRHTAFTTSATSSGPMQATPGTSGPGTTSPASRVVCRNVTWNCRGTCSWPN